ncbi:MAG TPA: hypothetical protein PLP07_00685 [Pyrinomonadaceae bacterium]|nr:hypothetical protein [Chloracidobacterium sp.]MBP9935526.1 hypothetical protein [Pyrinomonadaceae bacterium]MBK7801189.1 hypothetical protein [Chloracidobacterium sp.]MBK9436512.1 hypothetical protein [Chloracidobacterium sp.]MBK9767389.1 hypothetical protein [Chloracidobacterium sp.]
MTQALEVSFNSPQCGWMSVGFEDANGEFHSTTAHAPHASALAELMMILTEVSDDSNSNCERILKWNRDPEEFDFRFVRAGDVLTLEIYQYPTETRDSSERELVFSHQGKVADVCRSFAVTFDQLHADRETDEFEFNWRQPFPFAEYEKFQSKLQQG